MRLMRPWREGGAFDTAMTVLMLLLVVIVSAHRIHSVFWLLVIAVGAGVASVVSLRPDVFHRLFHR